jgi:hypothetical protein
MRVKERRGCRCRDASGVGNRRGRLSRRGKAKLGVQDVDLGCRVLQPQRRGAGCGVKEAGFYDLRGAGGAKVAQRRGAGCGVKEAGFYDLRGAEGPKVLGRPDDAGGCRNWCEQEAFDKFGRSAMWVEWKGTLISFELF